MLPWLLARDIQNGIKQFLVTGFEPSDEFFHGLMRRFVEKESVWMKGPFLQAGLPFRQGPGGRRFFENFETRNPRCAHQEATWQRRGERQDGGLLYPLLDPDRSDKAEGPPAGTETADPLECRARVLTASPTQGR